MSLPTLWVNVPYNRATLAIPGASVSAYVDGATRIEGEVAYVPASALDAANEENKRLRALLQTQADVIAESAMASHWVANLNYKAAAEWERKASEILDATAALTPKES